MRAFNNNPKLATINKKDCALAADMLFDLMLYKTERLIRLPSHLVMDYNNKKEAG